MNATIFHGVTLGRRRVYSKENDGRYVELFPTLENDVWIGPNAMIFGNVTIGEGAKVGPGAYVAFDVDPFCLVVGNPGQVVKKQVKADVHNRVCL